MARSRNIKPSFFMNEELVELPAVVRLLFIGLWTIADREGRLADRPKKIKMEILPCDEIDIEDALNQLVSRNFLIRYEVEGNKYIQITNFVKHQDPHYKEKASEIPPPAGHQNLIKACGVSSSQRRRILERDNYICQQCKATSDLCIDHILPVSRGGDSSDENLQVLCMACNTRKGNKLDGELNHYRKKSGQRTPTFNVDSNSGQHRVELKSTSLKQSDASPSDSLIPDSLIPDSLIPTNTCAAQAPHESVSANGEVENLGDDPPTPPSTPPPESPIRQRDAIRQVWRHWQTVMNHPNATLDDKRKRVIARALQRHTVEELCQAIDGCKLSPFHMGANDSGKVYDGVKVIFRDSEQIEGFIRVAQEPPVPTSRGDPIAEENQRVIEEFLKNQQAKQQ